MFQRLSPIGYKYTFKLYSIYLFGNISSAIKQNKLFFSPSPQYLFQKSPWMNRWILQYARKVLISSAFGEQELNYQSVSKVTGFQMSYSFCLFIHCTEVLQTLKQLIKPISNNAINRNVN